MRANTLPTRQIAWPRHSAEKLILLSGEYKLPKTDLVLTPARGRCQSCETNTAHLSYATLVHREATRDDQCGKLRRAGCLLRPVRRRDSTPTRTRCSPALREEAPLYYNEQHDFYALSRFDDVNKALIDHETFSSARGAMLEIIKANIEIPPGTLIFEDPPIHDIHRKLLSRMFTPRKINALEPKIRELLRAEPGPAGGHRPVRFRQRPRRADADAGDRHAAGHPRGRPGDDPRPRQRAVAHRGRQAHGAARTGWSPARSSRPSSTGAPTTLPTTS